MTQEKGWRNSPGSARPELEFILCCGRALVNPAAGDRVRALIQSGLNWPGVLSIAGQHRLSPVVYEVVAGSAQDIVSPEQLNLLRQAAAPSMEAGKALLRELLRLHHIFSEAEILAIPYKGPLLAWVAYGGFLRREYLDLDFAVEQENIPRTLAVLASAGYRPQFDPREAHAGKHGIAPGQYSFYSEPLQILAEFHTERTLRYFPSPVDFQDLKSRLMTIEIGQQRLQTFSIEDTLVMLSVHGTKHFWERLGWVLDIAKLITMQPVDWPLLSRIAEKMESTRVVLLGLYLAHDLFEAPLPPEVLGKIFSDRVVRDLAGKIYEQYAGISDPSAGVFSRAEFRLRSRDRFWQGLRHLVRLGISPTERDLETLRLPRPLAPLYVLVRPLRLLGEHGLGWKRRVESKPRADCGGRK